MNLFDLEVRTQAALLQALRRILARPGQGTAAFLSSKMGIEDLEGELRSKPLRIHNAIKANPYYHSMFKIWFRLHSFYPRDENSIRQESLWGNRWITNSKGPLQNATWAKKGIRIVQDICHPTEDRLLSQVELQAKYEVRVTFLDMLALRLSIPILWRQMLSNNWLPPPFSREDRSFSLRTNNNLKT